MSDRSRRLAGVARRQCHGAGATGDGGASGKPGPDRSWGCGKRTRTSTLPAQEEQAPARHEYGRSMPASYAATPSTWSQRLGRGTARIHLGCTYLSRVQDVHVVGARDHLLTLRCLQRHLVRRLRAHGQAGSRRCLASHNLRLCANQGWDGHEGGGHLAYWYLQACGEGRADAHREKLG